jgi:hypothetical protein
MVKRALLALKLSRGTQVFQKLYLDQLKILKKSFFFFFFFDFIYFVAKQIFWAWALLGSFSIYASISNLKLFSTYVDRPLIERRMSVRMGLIRAQLAYG